MTEDVKTKALIAIRNIAGLLNSGGNAEELLQSAIRFADESLREPYRTHLCQHDHKSACVWCAGGPSFQTPEEEIKGSLEAMESEFKNAPDPLCEDEGCDHYGTPHVCFSRSVESGTQDSLSPNVSDKEDAEKWRAFYSSAMYCMGSAGFGGGARPEDATGYRHMTLNLWTFGDTNTKTSKKLGYGNSQDVAGHELLDRYVNQAIANRKWRKEQNLEPLGAQWSKDCTQDVDSEVDTGESLRRVDASGEGFKGRVAPAVTTGGTTHRYEPHPKYPWFCKKCGYPEYESLKHTDADK